MFNSDLIDMISFAFIVVASNAFRLRSKRMVVHDGGMRTNLSPLISVSDSCKVVSELSNNVAIDQSRIEYLARELALLDLVTLKLDFEWDKCGWHFVSDAKSGGPLTCQYIFVLDALNFCFWPSAELEYDYLATSLTRVLLETDPKAFDSLNLIALDKTTLQSWFPKFVLPLIDERVDRLHELGRALEDEFGGLAINMVRAAEFSASKLVKLILMHIPGFRDTAVYRGKLIHFYKRAQILCGDIWAAYGRPGPMSRSIFGFHDLQDITMFADYRVPQILRDLGVLVYSTELSHIVDNKIPIMAGSEIEIEIRACTVEAVRLLHVALMGQGVKDLLVLEVDWMLWQRGENSKNQLKPHHRTLTIYY